jgi:uncharacterized membrane protein HdeD (DUF308 family)
MFKSKINQLTIISILSVTVSILAGILLIIKPVESIKVISYIIATTLIVSGIMLILKKSDSKKIFDFTTLGVCLILPGIVIVLYSKLLLDLIPILVGMWIIINSVIKLRISMSFRVKESSYYTLLVTSILQLLVGIIMLINPEISNIAITTFIGMLMIIYSINEIVNILMIRKYAERIISFFE